MKIADYIRENVLLKRLEKEPSLLVYDPGNRLKTIVSSLENERIRVIDGSQSTILARAEVVHAFNELAEKEGDGHRLVVYLPVSAPSDNEQKCEDPYAFLGAVGAVFPDGDGDELISICREAKPGKADEVNKLFTNGIPEFETIDALDGGGSQWPTLKSMLNAESPMEILERFLNVDESECKAFDSKDGWVDEMHHLVESLFGLKLKTKGRKWRSLAEEIWRLALFSEFALDLPSSLPAELVDVPKAKESSRDFIFRLCAQLRERRRYQQSYIDQANRVEEELGLYNRMADYSDLGERDTFAFEERSFLKKCVKATLTEDYDEARRILKQHGGSVWIREGVSVDQWSLVEKGLELLVAINDFEPLILQNAKDLKDLIAFYTGRAKQVDRIHREFEQAAEVSLSNEDFIDELKDAARKRYRHFADTLEESFITLVRNEGWPVGGLKANSGVFDACVAPHMSERKKVAFFMVDALRYELASELEKHLKDVAKTTLSPVAAQLPTVTPFGMASLLPKAHERLAFENRNGALVPVIDGKIIKTPSDRLTYLQSEYGDRVEMLDLDQLVGNRKWRPRETTNLLVVKTNEIDELGETQPKTALIEIPRLLKKVIAGVNRLSDMDFDQIIIGTDHGFVILHEYEAGDVATKPTGGEWSLSKDRCLIGKGSANGSVIRFSTSEVGIPTEEEDYIVPSRMVPFIRGRTYFHSGLSLQECILPVLEVELGSGRVDDIQAPVVEISYRKGKSSKITSRRPSFELSMLSSGLFSGDEPFEVLLEAYDSKNQVVGEVVGGPNVNPATQCVRVGAGQTLSVNLRMDDDFEGTFTVKASNPSSGVLYNSFKLKTDYAI